MNKEMILRLTRYKRLLHKLRALGLEKVFSNNLGDALGVSAALVRKDFSHLSLSGNKRGGYNIDGLIEELDNILGSSGTTDVVLAGCGNIGTALMNYTSFEREGLRIVAGFDMVPEKVRPPREIPIYPISILPSFVQKHNVELGIIAVPDSEANKVLEIMIDSGIRGVLNFAPIELRCSKNCGRDDCENHCTIHNVDIGLELEYIFHQVQLKKKCDSAPL